MNFWFSMLCLLFVFLGPSSSFSFSLIKTSPVNTFDSLPVKSKSQYPIRATPIIGTSLTYLPRTYFSKRLVRDILVNEFIWSINTTFPLNKRFEVGLNYYGVIKSDEERGRSYHWLAGVFSQLQLVYFRSGRVYLENGFYYGNLCHCRPEDYTQEGLVYFNFGSGTNLKLNQQFSLDLAIQNFLILTKLPNKETNSIYTAGINYQF